jgi:hypothetical protein
MELKVPDTSSGVLSRMTDEFAMFVIELFARGYTVRTIRRKIQEKMQMDPTEKDLLRLAILYAEDIEKYKKELAEMVFTSGLGIASERLSRLSELAESWEDKATKDPKAAQVYLKTLETIQREVAPLNLVVQIPSTDPWFQILSKLRGQSRQLSPPTTTSESSSISSE